MRRGRIYAGLWGTGRLRDGEEIASEKTHQLDDRSDCSINVHPRCVALMSKVHQGHLQARLHPPWPVPDEELDVARNARSVLSDGN